MDFPAGPQRTPRLREPREYKISFFEHNGLGIHYEVTGAGEPVFYLPGFSESIAAHMSLREKLSTHYQVVSADLPGSGQSQPQPRSYTPTYHRDDANAFVALIDAVVGGPVHLIGYSDGGEVALMIASLHPRYTRSVLTWGAVGFASDPSGVLNDFYNVIDRPSPAFADYSRYLISTYGADRARAMTKSFAANGRAIIDAGGDISRSQASKIECPLVIIVGEHDSSNSIKLAEQYASLVNGGKAIEVAGAGHDVHVSHSAWFDRMVLDWLDGISAKG